ncbi:MAG TPA: DUF4870 domain-containing protein [Amnibacterium sp.]
MSDRDGRARPAYGVTLPPRAPTAAEVTPAFAVHLVGGILAVVGLAANLVPLLALVPSLVLFVASRARPGWRREEAREALNFQITWVAAMLLLQGVALAVALLLSARGLHSLAVGFFTVFLMIQTLVAFFDLVVSIVAAVRSRRGGGFHYPLRLDLVK